jgi:thiol-disulfide isomerase/thioredoxin
MRHNVLAVFSVASVRSTLERGIGRMDRMNIARPTAFVLASVFVLAAAAMAPRLRASSPLAPDVALERDDGSRVQLSEYKGKVLLLDFWASWCAPCKVSFPALDAIYREYQPRGLEVLAVNLDEQRRAADAFLAQHPHVLPVLFDPKGVAPQAFGVKGMPTSFLIDRAGAIRFTHMGYTGNVDASYRREIAQLLAER